MCFNLYWLEHLFIWLVVVCFIIGVIRIVIPMMITPFPYPWIISLLNLLLGAIIAIAVIILVFDLLSCLLSPSGLRP
jgi:hypothetical protein